MFRLKDKKNYLLIEEINQLQKLIFQNTLNYQQIKNNLL